MADRALSAAMVAAMTQPTVRPVLFFEGEFATGTLRLWSGLGPKVWNGNTWVGAGNLASVSPIVESKKLTANGFSAKLTGMPSTNIGLIKNSLRQNKPGSLWLGLLDASEAVIADPYKLQRGRTDVAVISVDGPTCTITINYESILADLERPRVRRYEPEDQKIDYPNDLGFDFVPTLQNLVVVWGK